jgi:hypothetical protein
MSFTSIQNLLEARLAAMVNVPTLQKENTRIAPAAGQPWCRFTLLPTQTVQETIGVTGTNKLAGLAQIDLFYPADKGTADVNLMADLIIDAFPRALNLSDANISLFIEVSWREAGMRIEQYYQVPVMLKYRAHQL